MDDTLLLVDKPVGFSSFQIVRLLQRKYLKVGHAGTLDPFASGLLIMLPNRATRQFESIQVMEKEYTGEIVLGVSTDTYDITGSLTEPAKAVKSLLDLEGYNGIAQRFIGEIKQVPPRFSALKWKGQRMYKLSREKKEIKMTPRNVIIKSFQIEKVDPPILSFKSVVGKGVYMRSLAHDFGRAAGCGASLLSLRRTRIGEYRVSTASTLGDIIRIVSC
ncbi:MAG: tRNA pseudouridine(55) synthase TruB [candidate division WOR-3 bacterium]|nr:MAG: tRNA pseudouridine(55) synthase TruB [candidate division WOR-3 bacterium]